MTWTSHPVVTHLPASIQRREVAWNKTSPFGKNVHFSWILCPVVSLPRVRAEQGAAHFSRAAPRLQPTLQKQAPGLAPLTLRLQRILLPAQEISSRSSMEIILVKSFSSAIRGVMWCTFYIGSRISPRVLHASCWPWLILLSDVQRCYAPHWCHICHPATARPVPLPIPLERAVSERLHEINSSISVQVCLLCIFLFWQGSMI